MFLLQNSATSAIFDTQPRSCPSEQQQPPQTRTNYISFASLTNNVTTNFNLVTINDTNSSSSSSSSSSTTNKEAMATKDEGGSASSSNSNKSYLFKSNNLNNNFCNMNGTTNQNNHHQRHMSVPVGGNATPVKTLPTSSSTFQASITQKLPENSPLKAPSTSTANKIMPANHQLYENIKIKSLNNINNNHNSNVVSSSNNVNVSYENINLEYINRLMKEGYSKESVISALCISRNNFEMACDILHEFVSTNQQTSKVCDTNR